MKASIDYQFNIMIYLENDDVQKLESQIISGTTTNDHRRKERDTLTLSLGIDDLFAKEYGNSRIGIRTQKSGVDIRLSQSAYADLKSNQTVFDERHVYRDGSKLTIVEATNPDYRLGYNLLENFLTF